MHPKLIEYFNRFNKEPKKQYSEFFTQYNLENYHQKLPYLFDIENFCIRLWQAFLQNQKICIYSDYDTDAVTATSSMFWGLKNFGFLEENLDFYAPDRFIEGYGMNLEAVQNLAKKFDLIISVDCGINSVLEAKAVAEMENCDLIITDHHHLSDEIPPALSVINPRLSEFYKKNLNLKDSFFATSLNSENSKKIEIYDFQKEFNSQQNVKIEKWLEKMQNLKPDEFLSSSVTGVGVAWFCLVWFGYFLEEMKTEEFNS